MADAETPVLIGIDWGTTSLRAYCIGKSGAVIDRVSSPAGILADHPDGFTGTFRSVTTPWRERFGPLPVVASGMIGSRNGWIETPYVEAPAGLADLARGLVPVEAAGGGVVHFVPGLSCADPAGTPDIMRGEEVQILGALADPGAGDAETALFLLPGTHSKWAGVRSGAIAWFETYMTGEMFSVLMDHSILGKLASPGDASSSGAFSRAVEVSLNGDGSLLHRAFSARTLPLFGRLPPEEIAAHLSGLLIGEEVRAALERARRGGARAVTIAGRGDLAEAYAAALKTAGIASSFAPDDVAARGHYILAKAGGLI